MATHTFRRLLIPSKPVANASDWDFIVGGFTWQGIWDAATEYFAGDAVVRNSNLILLLLLLLAKNQKLMLLAHTGIHRQKVPANVLTDTGDILYRAGAGAARLPVGNNGRFSQFLQPLEFPNGK